MSFIVVVFTVQCGAMKHTEGITMMNKHIEILEDLLISIRNHKIGVIDSIEKKRFDLREESLLYIIKKLREEETRNGD